MEAIDNIVSFENKKIGDKALTSILCNVTTAAHHDANVASLEGRGVVDTISSDSDRVVTPNLRLLNDTKLLFGSGTSEDDLSVQTKDRVPVGFRKTDDVVAGHNKCSERVVLAGLDRPSRSSGKGVVVFGVAQV